MKALHLRSRLAWLLLAALILPILAACGGTPTPGAASTPGASTSAGGSEASAAPAVSAAPAESTAPEASAEASTEASALAASSAATNANPDYISYGNTGEPDDLDSMNTTTGASLIIAQQIEENLLEFKPGTLELVDGLATEWTPNADSSEWTFKLREGVKFQDGTDFNADAVVFNFQRLADPNFEYGYRAEGKTYEIFPNIFGAFKGEPNTLWKDVTAVDANTVKFTMTQPVPLLPNYLAASYFAISSPEAIKKAKEKYGTPEFGAVGTGPFEFQEWRPGESVTLKRFEGYWGEKAKSPGVVFRILADASQRFTELQAGSIDFATSLAPDTRETLKGGGDLKEVEVVPFNVAYLSLNITNKPFDDVRVRQAIAHAINKQEILDAFYSGVGSVADDFLPDGLKQFRPGDLDPYAYDPEKAKALLAEAGFPDGFDTMTLSDGTQTAVELWYMPVSRPYFATPKSVAEAFAAQLADVGIKVELKTEDWGVYLDNWEAGKKNGMVMLGWTGDYADPANFLFTHFGPGNALEAGYSNQELWELMGKASAATTEEESIKLWQQAGTVINKDLVRIPIVHAPPVYAQNNTVTGWTPNPTGGESYVPIEVGR